MNTAGAPVRRRAAARPHHRRAGALLPARRDAADSEQARELGHLPDRHPRRDGEGQGEPPHSVQSEGTAGGDPRTASGARSGRVRVRQRERAPTSRTSRPAWETLRLLAQRHRAEARKGGSAMESRTARADRSPLARPAARRRVPPARRRRRHPDHPADARTREHPADAALPERDGRRTQERTGGELEQQRPTASPGIGKLIGLVSFAGLSPFCPRELEIVVAGAGFEPATFGL